MYYKLEYRAVDKVDSALTILGSDQYVDWFDIRQVYQNKIAISNTDKGGCEDFIEIREAYEMLNYSYHGTRH